MLLKKWVRCNNKPHTHKELRKAIMKSSRLKNKANKTKMSIDISNFKKRRNYVVNLKKKLRLNTSVLITLLTANRFG